ncbi:hypothetical protein [Nocardia macrotermitis]|uniref:Uncharacterized protein n=1 Tax=Nocardia macrotermitis TaxID=2585198 RepID=A0A7K0D8Z0_9NOCA|nr:hypothetical protein [Nocardia macrotermitis]MQY21334.1 hypothetical protein [Nocardia macrotermitis]
MGWRSAWQRWTGRGASAGWDPEQVDPVVVVSSFDDAESCSAALERAAESWTPGIPALLRHHLRIPAEHVETVTALAAQDGYSPAGTAPATADLLLQRMQILDALHCSQERSRMASLAQRHDGTALGWDALQPPRT